jgi:hypothetical protein
MIAQILREYRFEHQDMVHMAVSTTRKVSAILSRDHRRIAVFDLDVNDEQETMDENN